jgi:hypothetical protein
MPRFARAGWLIAVALAVIAWGIATASAQPRKIRRIGVVGYGPARPSPQLEGFRASLRELGWIDGQTAVIEQRWAEGRPERVPAQREDRESAGPPAPGVLAVTRGPGHRVTGANPGQDDGCPQQRGASHYPQGRLTGS